MLRRIFLFLAAALIGQSAPGYDFITDNSGIYVVTWPPGPITMNLKMPAPASPLTDGGNYNTSAQAAMALWNGLIGIVQLSPQIQAAGPATSSNGVNEVVMDSTVGGKAFGTNTLAVTLSYTRGNARVESDIVFNIAFTWDSYRGPRSGRTAIDIQRVAIHELGHVLGLDHPDEGSPPQYVNAIMNSRITDVDYMQPDDIAGARILYGSPGFVPPNDNFENATPITFSGTSGQVTGINVGATRQAGEPNHAGNTDGHSVWWKWTAPADGTVTITTLGSIFDTALAAYTGSSVSSLTQLAANDDVEAVSTTSSPTRIRTSTVTFDTATATPYSIVVEGWDGAMAAITVNLTFTATGVGTPPSITLQPASQTTTPGGSTTFTVIASGNPTGYQWSFNGSSIAGATGTSYTLNNVKAADAGNYQVLVRNAAGFVTSSAATLTVPGSPVLNGIVTSGHDIAFTAMSANNVQWQVSTDGGVTWTDLANNATYRGVNTPTLEIFGATTAMNGQRYRYVTVLNGGSSVSNPATLTVSPAVFSFPVSVTVDASGNLYVADTSTDTIRKVSATGSASLLAGSSGQTGTADGAIGAARFNDPSGVVAAADGTLGVSDNANATIRLITTGGTVTTLAGSTINRGNNDATGSAATFSSPIGIGRDGAGNLYVADATNHTVRKVTPAGVVTTLAGSAGVAGSTDATGTAARFNHPTGIAVDGAGTVYVADSTNNLIRKITPGGVVTTLAGVAGVAGSSDGTGNGALFNNPGGLAVDDAGNVYVADTGNSIVRKITPGGAVQSLAGLPGIAGLKDGTKTEAWFNQPSDVAVDRNGNVFVADTGNATIRKITPDGVVTTLALSQGATVDPDPPTPTPPTPTPPSTPSSGGGGGGGSMNGWVAIALGFICLVRWIPQKSRRTAVRFPG